MQGAELLGEDAFPLLRLPHELLVQVLSHLDSSCLAHAASASSRLRQAAAAARSSIATGGRLFTAAAWKSLLCYLAAHGRHITDFCIFGWERCPLNSAQLSRCLAALPNLCSLVLPEHARLEPAMLSTWPDLQHLELKDVAPPGVPALLAQLQHLTQLSCLSLSLDGADIPPTSFSAVTASSSTLQQLHLAWCNMPQQAWEAMFPADLRLPQLTDLALKETGTALGAHRQTPGLSAAALSRLADSCASSLQDLTLEWHMYRDPPTVELEPLQRLTALTGLRVGCVTVQSATKVLPQLTNLRALEICPPSKLCPGGMLPLTALRQLTFLEIMEKWTRPEEAYIKNQAPAGAPPDVWQQLPQHILPEEEYEDDEQAELEWLVEEGFVDASEVFDCDDGYYGDGYW